MPPRCCARCRRKGVAVHAICRSPDRIGIVPCARWLRPLAAFFFLAFGLLLSAEEADARLARDARFADGERAIGLNQLALAAHQEEISPRAAQPAYPAGSLGGLFSRPGLIGGFAAGFLGAGIFGLLFGHGLIGELSGVSSILGLVFQFALLLALGLADPGVVARRSGGCRRPIVTAAIGRRLRPRPQRGIAGCRRGRETRVQSGRQKFICRSGAFAAVAIRRVPRGRSGSCCRSIRAN